MARARPCVASESPAAEWKGFATRRTTRPSAKVPTTRQCSSLPRQSRIALETSLLLKSRPHFFVCHRHSANAPRIERHIDRIRQRRIGDVFFLQKLFHQLCRLARSTQDCKPLPRLPSQTISRDCAVVIDAQKQIFLRARANLGKKQPRQKGRTINLLERAFHHRAKGVMRETAQ